MRAFTRQLPALVAVAAIAAASAACSSSSASPTPPSDSAGTGTASAGFPVTVTTAAGTTQVTARPGAIVSLSPTATEMLYAIGAGSQVKAVDDDSDYPRQAPMTKLSGYTPNAEAIAAYKPDLVIISNNLDGITAKLTALSIPVLDLPAAANLADVYAEFTELGAATGHVAQAKTEDTTLKADIKQIVAVRAGACQAADVLLRDRDRSVLLGDLVDVRRQLAVAARHEEHRRRCQRGRGRGRISVAVSRVHPEGQPGLHHPGGHRQHRRRSGCRHGTRAARLVSADGREGQAHHPAEPRHRIALGTANRRTSFATWSQA